MNGERSAIEHVAETIQTALNVLGPAKVSVSGPDSDGLYSLTCNRDEGIRQRLLRLRTRLTLRVVQEAGDPRAQTVSYHHTLWKTARGAERELLSYHWPGDGSEPHVHVGGGKEHIGTGRITVEVLIRYCIQEAGWEPRDQSWDETLKVTAAHYQWNRTWQ